MAHSFSAFIDESGGEKGSRKKGGSEWFVITAVVCESTDLPRVTSVLPELRKAFKRDDKWSPKFSDIKGNEKMRIVLGRLIGSRPVKIASVLVHKPNIKSASLREDHAAIYNYVSSFLLERISLACRQLENPFDFNDGTVEIVFSRRKHHSYQAFRDYIDRLKGDPIKLRKVSIDWGVVKSNQIISQWDQASPGCRIADYAAGIQAFAVEPKEHSLTDDRPIRELENVLLRSDSGSLIGYGVKFWPREGKYLSRLDSRFDWLYRYFGEKHKKPRGPTR